MGFVETTRKMADEVAAAASAVQALANETFGAVPGGSQLESLADGLGDLAAAVQKLARCVSRRFPGTPDGEE